MESGAGGHAERLFKSAEELRRRFAAVCERVAALVEMCRTTSEMCDGVIDRSRVTLQRPADGRGKPERFP